MLYPNRHILIEKFTIHSNPSFVVEVFLFFRKIHFIFCKAVSEEFYPKKYKLNRLKCKEEDKVSLNVCHKLKTLFKIHENTICYYNFED